MLPTDSGTIYLPVRLRNPPGRKNDRVAFLGAITGP